MFNMSESFCEMLYAFFFGGEGVGAGGRGGGVKKEWSQKWLF